MFTIKVYNGGTEVYHDLFREGATEEEVKEWCEYMYSNSAYWLSPNLWLAIQRKSNTEFIVPLMDYNDLTGEDYDDLTGEVEVILIRYSK